MASSRISYGVSTIGGAMVAEWVSNLYTVKEDAARIVGMMNSKSGGGVNPEDLEASAEFNVAASLGDEFYSAVNNIKATLDSISTAELAKLDAGE